ncbi:MAG: HAMP domain-containing histidine kinase [Salinivirgaceae bacterium]|nr:HAMP domain-containing histidine kinase [Salinivirgaceae bacterium]
MNTYRNKVVWKSFIIVCATLIGGISLYYTNVLARNMATEEHKRMQIWAEAIRQMQISENEVEINFCLEIIRNNTSIPVILTADDNIVVQTRNLSDSLAIMSDSAYSARRIEALRAKHDPIVINLPDNHKNFIYYDDSTVLKQLAHFPFIQMSIIAIFLLVAYLAFSSSRRAEQNKVWIGMSKETAHQLGTPISSLMAWIEILKQDESNASYVTEMQKDIDRLQMIADRFSKIGSLPTLQPCNLSEAINTAVGYMRTRVSSNITLDVKDNTSHSVMVRLNTSLFNWVIENMIKNAIDAMEGKGCITIKLNETLKFAEILITDTGKGLAKNQFKAIFSPGYTTKERGWGLGLSLVQRIVNEYHRGKIAVQSSELGVGTTFRILLPKVKNRDLSQNA